MHSHAIRTFMLSRALRIVGGVLLAMSLGLGVGPSFTQLAADPLLGSETAKLTPGDAVNLFGFSVAISGDLAVVGVRQDEAAYLFGRNQGGSDNWGQIKKLTAGDGGAADWFGYSVALSGDYVFVGAYRDDDNGTDSGSVYVFSRDEGGADNWGELTKLTAEDGVAGDAFGYSLAADTEETVVYLVVGAYADDDACEAEPQCNSGSVYFFQGSTVSSTWIESRKFLASDGAAGDLLGSSVAVDAAESTVLVGAPRDDDACPGNPNCNSGAAYVFSTSQSTEIRKLVASEPAGADEFGSSVATLGDLAAVGLPYDDDLGSSSGSVELFGRDEGGLDNWGLLSKLTAGQTVSPANDLFGTAVALSSDGLLVGAPNAQPESVYHFQPVPDGSGDWYQAQRLTASDGSHDHTFGAALGIDGDTATAVVGAEGNEAAYIFDFVVVELDLGDAPDPLGEASGSYPTYLAHDGARHIVGSGPYLGASVDADTDGQPDASALGDDTDGTDDEDGVVFTGDLLIGAQATVDVTTSGAGELDAWIDFDRNGVWEEGEEHVLNQSVSAGLNSLQLNVPADAISGETFARFRLATAGVGGPTGLAEDGEVEDHQVEVVGPTTVTINDITQLEGSGAGTEAFTFNVTRSDNTRTMTVQYRTEPLSATSGVDFNAISLADLDFVAGGAFTRQITVEVLRDAIAETTESFHVHIFSPNPAEVIIGDAYGQGDIQNDDAAQVSIQDVSNTEGFDGTTPFGFVVTADAATENFLVDFTTQDGSATTADGDYLAASGSVVVGQTIWINVVGDARPEGDETFNVILTGLSPVDPLVTLADDTAVGTILDDEVDFGDAPDPLFPTRLVNDGARHLIVPGFWLGAAADGELDGLQSADADGDDLDGVDDEDGVVFTSSLTAGGTATVDVSASAEGLLDAWIDFNRDQDWGDPGEKIFTAEALSAGVNHLELSVPPSVDAGVSFARFRFSSAGVEEHWGVATDGEVEDYAVELSVVTDVEPPEVVNVTTNQDTGDGMLSPGEVSSAYITEFLVTFSEDMYDPPGDWDDPDDVTNPVNYRIVGDDFSSIETSGCEGDVAPTDWELPLNAVSYDAPSRTATLSVNDGFPLPDATYRLFACGATSLKDQALNSLDGNGDGTGGDDFVLDFAIAETIPTAHPGRAREVVVDVTIVLGGLPSATGGTPPYSYSWTVTPMAGVTLSSTTEANPMFSSSIEDAYETELTVTDSNGLESGPGSTTIWVGCDRIDLYNQTINGPRVYTARNEITAERVSVYGEGVVFQAGESVVFMDGFVVESFAEFTVVIDSASDCR